MLYKENKMAKTSLELLREYVTLVEKQEDMIDDWCDSCYGEDPEMSSCSVCKGTGTNPYRKVVPPTKDDQKAWKKFKVREERIAENHAWENSGPKCNCGHPMDIHTGQGCMFGAGVGKKCNCLKFRKEQQVKSNPFNQCDNCKGKGCDQCFGSGEYAVGVNKNHYE